MPDNQSKMPVFPQAVRIPSIFDSKIKMKKGRIIWDLKVKLLTLNYGYFLL